MKNSLIALLAGFAGLTLLAGCARQVTRPTQPPRPAQVKFSTFNTVEVTPVILMPPFDTITINQQAKGRINGELMTGLRAIFPNLKETNPGAAASGQPGVLRIEPVIRQIFLVNSVARFFAGKRAGNSALRIQVIYRDLGSGKIIADPEFYELAQPIGARKNNEYNNEILSRAAQDIINYTAANK